MATHSLELSDKSADTTPWDGSKSAARDRLNTSVDPTVFSRIGANEGAVVSTSANLKVSVPLRSFVRAAWSVFTLDVFSVGDTPLADLKDQAVTVNTNVGLLSALILTIVVPIAFDAVLQPQTNSYIQTKAPWVGQLYFVCLFITCVGYMFATLSSVYCILIVNETTSSTQTRYLLEAAKSEFLYPVQRSLAPPPPHNVPIQRHARPSTPFESNRFATRHVTLSTAPLLISPPPMHPALCCHHIQCLMAPPCVRPPARTSQPCTHPPRAGQVVWAELCTHGIF